MLIGISFLSTAQYADYFSNVTMRMDYNYVGNSGEELFAFDQMVNDGEWPVSKTYYNKKPTIFYKKQWVHLTNN